MLLDIQTLKPKQKQYEDLKTWLSQKKPSSMNIQERFLQNFMVSKDHDIPEALRLWENMPQGTLKNMALVFMYLHLATDTESSSLSQEQVAQGIQRLHSYHTQIPTVLDPEFDRALAHLHLQHWASQEAKTPSHALVDRFFDTFVGLSTSQDFRVDVMQRFYQNIPSKRKSIQHHFKERLPEADRNLPEFVSWYSSAKPSSKSSSTGTTKDESQQMLEQGLALRQDKKWALSMTTFSTLMRDYPSTEAAQTAKQTLRSILRDLMGQNQSLLTYTDNLSHLPPEPLYDLSRYLWNANENETAKSLFLTLIERYPYHERAGDALYILGRMAENINDYDRARMYDRQVYQRFPSSRFAARARFKDGFLSYLLQDFDRALAVFDEELTQPVGSTLRRSQILYWKHKTLSSKGKRSRPVQQEILQQYPYTYYATILENAPDIKKNFSPSKQSSAYPIDEVTDLLSVGLHGLVVRKLHQLIELTPDQQFELSSLLNQAHMYHHSMNMMFQWFEQNPTLYRNALELFFPQTPLTFFDKDQTYAIPVVVAMSIMKQESAFNSVAVSPANAHGLMQLILPTAKRMGRVHDMQIRVWDLFEPHTNILLGTTYIDINLKELDNNLVDALVAYNAGPTRAKRWRKRWHELDPDAYIEMIPIQETRTYVKLILRNISFYRHLYGSDFGEAIAAESEKNLDYKGLPANFIK